MSGQWFLYNRPEANLLDQVPLVSLGDGVSRVIGAKLVEDFTELPKRRSRRAFRDSTSSWTKPTVKEVSMGISPRRAVHRASTNW